MKAYSTGYEFHSNLYEESREVRKPSRKFSKLREEIMGKWEHVFKEELEPTDRMGGKPVKLKMKEGYINPSFCSKPFDTPFRLRTMYEKEIERALDAGHIVPCSLEPSEWSSKAFPVVKGDGTSCSWHFQS